MTIKCGNNKGSIFGAWWGNWDSQVVFLSIISLAYACLVCWWLAVDFLNLEKRCCNAQGCGQHLEIKNSRTPRKV